MGEAMLHREKRVEIIIFFFVYILVNFVFGDCEIRTEYYIDDNKVSLNEFKKRGNTGLVKIYEGGTLMLESYLKCGKEHGQQVRYYKNGQKASIVEYKNGIKNGKIIEWYESGDLKAQGVYEVKNSKVNHNLIEWDEDGNIYKKIDVIDGKGISIEWYKNGQKFIEKELINNRREGSFKMWYANGVLAIRGEYRDGVMHGTWKEYYENGILRSLANFIEGTEHGEFKEWYDNGNIKEEYQYVNGKRNGTWKKYSQDGAVISEEVWENDKLIKNSNEGIYGSLSDL